MSDSSELRNDQLRNLLKEQQILAKLSFDEEQAYRTKGPNAASQLPFDLAMQVTGVMSQFAEGITKAVGVADVGHAFQQVAYRQEPSIPPEAFQLPSVTVPEPQQQTNVVVEQPNQPPDISKPDFGSGNPESLPAPEFAALPEEPSSVPAPMPQFATEPPPVPDRQKLRPDFLTEDMLPPSTPFRLQGQSVEAQEPPQQNIEAPQVQPPAVEVPAFQYAAVEPPQQVVQAPQSVDIAPPIAEPPQPREQPQPVELPRAEVPVDIAEPPIVPAMPTLPPQPQPNIQAPPPPVPDPPLPELKMRLDPNDRDYAFADNMDTERMVMGASFGMASMHAFEELLQWQRLMTNQLIMLASQQRELCSRVEQWMPYDVNPLEYN